MGKFAVSFIGTTLLAMIVSSITFNIFFKDYRPLIDKCEASLPRNQHCVLVAVKDKR